MVAHNWGWRRNQPTASAFPGLVVGCGSLVWVGERDGDVDEGVGGDGGVSPVGDGA